MHAQRHALLGRLAALRSRLDAATARRKRADADDDDDGGGVGDDDDDHDHDHDNGDDQADDRRSNGDVSSER